MSNSSFLFNFLPSFYKDRIVDENGNSLLTPIFDVYVNAMGDSLYQAQQLSQLPYLESCPWYIEETFTTINTTSSNRYKDGFIIANEIIKYGNIYFNGSFTSKCNITYTIKHDVYKNIRYIVFDSQIEQDTLFAEYCRKDYKILQRTFGKLLKHDAVIPNIVSVTTDTVIDFLAIEAQYKLYRNRLIAIWYGLNNNSSIEVLTNVVGIYCGLPYSTIDGIIVNISGNDLDIQDDNTGDIKTFSCTYINPLLQVGQRIKKYTVLEKAPYRLFDLQTNPSRFACYLLGYLGKYTNSLITVNKNDNEKDASLYFDTLIKFDDENLYWDMGHNFLDAPPPTDINIPSIPSFEYTDTQFIFNPYFVDPGFVEAGFVDGNTQLLFEMFRNLLILEYTDSHIANIYDVQDFASCITSDLKNVLRRILDTHLNIMYVNPMYFVETGFVDPGFAD